MAATSGGTAAMFGGTALVNGGTYTQIVHNYTEDPREVLRRDLLSRIRPELFYDSEMHDDLCDTHDFPPINDSEIENLIKDVVGSRQVVLRRHFSPPGKASRPYHGALKIAEYLENRGLLLAGIVIPSKIAPKELTHQLIFMIVYQMLCSDPVIASIIQSAIENNPRTLKCKASVRIKKWIIEPLVKAAEMDPSNRRPLTPNYVVIAGSHSQIADNSAAARVFDTISTMASQEGLDSPIRVVFISSSKTFSPFSYHTIIIIILSFSGASRESKISMLIDACDTSSFKGLCRGTCASINIWDIWFQWYRL
ncbi:hypothetical protein BDN70DRAFT_933361 [Pholiota conissans]|uniref:Uncharacterized protein n=1 Tax=Pholiota conissans TaxID=109636 RepID=A0A9P5YZS0_9AGAR|nr:hypothetical protein BDN70DRAFT_933361 [Pholiota conissans]